MTTPLIGLASEEHIKHTVQILEEALEDAKAGKLSSCIIFADLRGTEDYRIWKSAHENYLSIVGKMQQACTDMCLKRSASYVR
jgi:hypothetical protein